MANTKVTGDLIASGTITAANLVSGTLDALLNSYLTTNTYATQGYVTTAVNNLIAAAPASLDTLNELAAALNDDANFATTVTNSLATKLNLSGGTLTGGLHVNTTSLPQLLIQNADGGTNAERIAIELTSGDIFKIRSLNDNNTTRVDNIITANILTGNVGISASASFRFNGVGDESHAVGYDSVIDGSFLRGQNGIRFLTGTGSGSEMMRINNAGQVKITRNNSSTAANNAHLILENISGNQSMLDFTFQDVRKASLRTDSSGNLVLNSDARNFYFNNDFPAAGDVYLINRDTTFLTAKSDGNVGIGTTGNSVGGQPGGTAGKLNVYTNAGSSSWAQQIRHDNSTGNGLFVRAGGNSSYYTAYLTGYDENNVHLVVRGDGNVGIGTNSPTKQLEVKNSYNGSQLTLRSTSGNSGNAGVRFSVADNTVTTDAYHKASIWLTGDGTGNALGDLTFNVNNVASSANVGSSDERMRLTREGYLGIGTTNPGYGLHVVNGVSGYSAGFHESVLIGPGGSTAANLRFSNMTGVYNTFQQGSRIFQYFSDGNGIAESSIYFNRTEGTGGGVTSGSCITFHTSKNTYSPYGRETDAERMRIDNKGNVGIGTSYPSSGGGWTPRLVASETSGYPAILVKGKNSVEGSIGAADAGLYIDCLGSSTGGNDIVFRNNNTVSNFNGSDRMRIHANGDITFCKSVTSVDTNGVFIQASADGAIYSSVGYPVNTYHVYNTLNDRYDFYVSYNGTIYARDVTIQSLSDQRLKENIQDLNGGLDKILALRPRTFDFKDGSKINAKGFVAQEVEEVLPECVKEYTAGENLEDGTRYKTVGQDFMPYLVKAIQEQQEIINNLKAEVEALKQQLNM